jgi:hypothetical protein
VLLLDNSAWSRIEQNILDEERKAMVADWYERRELAICLPFHHTGFQQRVGRAAGKPLRLRPPIGSR